MKMGRTVVFGVATTLLASFAALAVVEVALRMTGFRYELRIHVIEATAPEGELVRRGYAIDPYLIWVDKGYYGRLDDAEKTGVDIALMGDSCTQFGAYGRLLADRIEVSTGRRVRTVNLGVAGWTTFQGRKQTTRDVARLHPRVATVYYGWNDHWLSIGLNDEQAEKINASILGRLQALRLGQLLTKARVTLAREKGEPVVRVAEAEFYENLTKIVQSLEELGTIPVLVTAPSSHARGSEPAYLAGRWISDLSQLVPMHERYVSIVRQVAMEQDAVLCDLALEFEKLGHKEDLEKYFYQDGIHLTAEGNQAAADFLFESFAEHGLVGASSR